MNLFKLNNCFPPEMPDLVQHVNQILLKTSEIYLTLLILKCLILEIRRNIQIHFKQGENFLTEKPNELYFRLIDQ